MKEKLRKLIFEYIGDADGVRSVGLVNMIHHMYEILEKEEYMYGLPGDLEEAFLEFFDSLKD